MLIDHMVRLSKERKERLKTGVEVLSEWIDLLLEQGIQVLAKDPHRLNDMATRAVDFGMPAIGRKLRLIPERIQASEEWTNAVLDELAEMSLIVQTAQSEQSPIHPEDLLTAMGVSIKKQEVIEHTEAIEDNWIYCGSIRSQEENILVCKNWFFGLESLRYALFIEFQVNRFVPLRLFQFGQMYTGYTHFYPSAIPLRVTGIPEAQRPIPDRIPFRVHTIGQFQELTAKAIISNPFVRDLPACLSRLRLIEDQSKFYISDIHGKAILLDCDESIFWKMMAYSLDQESIFIGSCLQKQFHPCSVFSKGFIEKID